MCSLTLLGDKTDITSLKMAEPSVLTMETMSVYASQAFSSSVSVDPNNQLGAGARTCINDIHCKFDNVFNKHYTGYNGF